MIWDQNYDPLGNPWVSTILAALPVLTLLGSLGILRLAAHWAALLGLAVALIIAITVFNMPASSAISASLLGALFGLLPIGWIILNIIFLYRLTLDQGLFEVLQDSIAGITQDRRLQLLLIAFCFGAFFEGASGFGTPVAVTGAILIGLGFPPILASALSLIANTAPVAFGSLAAPILALQTVTGLDLQDLSSMIGRQLPIFSLIIPFWLIAVFAGMRGMLQVWPAILVAAVSFALPQYLISNFYGPSLVDVVSSLISMACLVGFLKFWQPKELWLAVTRKGDPNAEAPPPAIVPPKHPMSLLIRAWTPWVILTVIVFVWGLPDTKAWIDKQTLVTIPWPELHNLVQRVPPVVAQATKEAAIFRFNWLSMTGSGILIASLIAGIVMGFKPLRLIVMYGQTFNVVKFSLVTIAAMMSVGYITRYSGLDATLGLAFAQTGVLYPFFGTLLGWLGVALTGSDTASNVLFGSLQKISSQQLGLSPVLMASANSSGGVMGKMIDAQSIVVATTATRCYGRESEILRFVFFHSIALACLVGVLVYLQAYVYPFTLMVVGG
jgi:lactate permease